MKLGLIWQEIRSNRVLWMLVFVPVALAAEHAGGASHTLLFALSVLALLPVLSATLNAQAGDEKPLKILYFTKSTRFEHTVVKQEGVDGLIKRLAQKNTPAAVGGTAGGTSSK